MLKTQEDHIYHSLREIDQIKAAVVEDGSLLASEGQRTKESHVSLSWAGLVVSWVSFRPTFRAKSSGPFESILVNFSRFFTCFQSALSILVDFSLVFSQF